MSQNHASVLVIESGSLPGLQKQSCPSLPQIGLPELQWAAGLEDARELLAENTYQLVFLDLSGNSQNAEQALQELRQSVPGMPVVVLRDGQRDKEILLALSNYRGDTLLENQSGQDLLYEVLSPFMGEVWNRSRTEENGEPISGNGSLSYTEVWKALLEQENGPRLILNADRQLLFANSAACELLGIDGECAQLLLPFEPGEEVRVEQNTALSGLISLRLKTSEILWENQAAFLIDVFVQEGSDALPYNETESRERYKILAEGMRDGAWDWDRTTSQVYYSPRFVGLIGYLPQEIESDLSQWLSRIHPQDKNKVLSCLQAHLEGQQDCFEVEHRLLCKSGEYRWFLMRGVGCRNGDMEITRVAGSLTDIQDWKQVEAQRRHAAFHDPLTGLPNRNYLIDRIWRLIRRSQRKPNFCYAVLFFDLDRFKLINEGLGHAAGDQYLIEVGRRLTTKLRPVDSVARLGGDEFVILLDDLDNDRDPFRVAYRIQDELARPIDLWGHIVTSSVSVGIALGNPSYQRPEELLRDADSALHSAKAQGKACVELFNETLHSCALERLQLETDLRRAIKSDEFEIYYQPIVDLNTGCTASLEALVRWNHPNLGLLSPDRFIPLAEETGLIVPLGERILAAACEEAQSFRELTPKLTDLRVSVNLSSKQFSQKALVRRVEEILKETGLPAGNLILEVTESVLSQNEQGATDTLKELRSKGISISLDDFGTGYSSLSRLYRFPISTLKIDRSFVSRMNSGNEGREVVQLILTLAKNLSMKVVAEGLEDEQQLQMLKEMACDYGQGYYYSKPMNAVDTARNLLVGVSSGIAFPWR